MRGTTRGLFGAIKSVWDAGRDMLFPTSTKASGMFNPKVAAVVALGIGLATQGWGSALAGSLGLTGAGAAAVSAGVSTVCAQMGVQTLQNNGDINTSVKDMTRTRALVHVLESMATAGVTSGVTGMMSGPEAHVARAGVREAVYTGFATAQGHKPAPKDIFARLMTGTFAGIAAESVGKIYAACDVDPIIHKLLHGGIGAPSGGILGGQQGALSGASAAVIAETLADVVHPQVEAALTEIAADHPHEQDFHNHVGAYIRHQKDLILLMSVAITASLGGDVDQATCAADNALKNNAMKTLLATTAGVIWEIVQIIHEDEIASGKDAAVDYVAKKTGVDKETVAASFDVVALGLSTGNAVKQGVKGVVKAGVKAATATKTPKQHVGSSQPVSKPDTLPAFPDAKMAAKKTSYPGGLRPRWKDKKYIYEWDSQHGTVEKYSKKGKHLGEFDAQTGAQLKPANKTRRIEP